MHHDDLIVDVNSRQYGTRFKLPYSSTPNKKKKALCAYDPNDRDKWVMLNAEDDETEEDQDAEEEIEDDPPAEDLAPPAADLAPPAEDLAPPAADLAPPAADLAPPAKDLAPPAADLAPPAADPFGDFPDLNDHGGLAALVQACVDVANIAGTSAAPAAPSEAELDLESAMNEMGRSSARGLIDSSEMYRMLTTPPNAAPELHVAAAFVEPAAGIAKRKRKDPVAYDSVADIPVLCPRSTRAKKQP